MNFFSIEKKIFHFQDDVQIVVIKEDLTYVLPENYGMLIVCATKRNTIMRAFAQMNLKLPIRPTKENQFIARAVITKKFIEYVSTPWRRLKNGI